MRLIVADALMKECYKELEDNSLWHDEDTSKDYADGHDEGKRIMMVIIDQAPSIDVVRCKECKWASPNKEGDYDCKCHIPIFRVVADDYCSYGEREDE